MLSRFFANAMLLESALLVVIIATNSLDQPCSHRDKLASSITLRSLSRKSPSRRMLLIACNSALPATGMALEQVFDVRTGAHQPTDLRHSVAWQKRLDKMRGGLQ
jgi:hypothetical protein